MNYPITMETLDQLLCQRFNVTSEQIKSKSRKRELIIPRHIFCFLAKEFVYEISLVAIGKYLGDRDHSTVIHAINSTEDSMYTDKAYRERVKEIQGFLNLCIAEAQAEAEAQEKSTEA